MRIDIHVHSTYSNDGSNSPSEILKYARKIKLDGIAITDHNELAGSLKLWKENKNLSDFLVIPAVEVSTTEGHILALGVTNPIPKELSPNETIEKIENQGGVAVASHPYRFWSGLGEDTVRRFDFKVLEVTNARSLRKENKKALALANELDLGKTGGSDSHTLAHIGDAYTKFESPADNYEDVLEQIRSGSTKGEGISRSPSATPKYVISCVYLWLKRGMKRI
jgi:predicted metal-dependent phosphoesterase TrpH